MIRPDTTLIAGVEAGWLDKLIESFGTHDGDEVGDDAFAVDFDNAIIGDPYITGTGFLPNRETAEAVANVLLPIISAVAVGYVEANPGHEFGWTDPMSEAERSYCYLISKARKGWGGDPQAGDPVVEEIYEGDVWFVASAELGLLSPEQRAMLDKLNAAIRDRRVETE